MTADEAALCRGVQHMSSCRSKHAPRDNTLCQVWASKIPEFGGVATLCLQVYHWFSSGMSLLNQLGISKRKSNFPGCWECCADGYDFGSHMRAMLDKQGSILGISAVTSIACVISIYATFARSVPDIQDLKITIAVLINALCRPDVLRNNGNDPLAPQLPRNLQALDAAIAGAVWWELCLRPVIVQRKCNLMEKDAG